MLVAVVIGGDYLTLRLLLRSELDPELRPKPSDRVAFGHVALDGQQLPRAAADSSLMIEPLAASLASDLDRDAAVGSEAELPTR